MNYVQLIGSIEVGLIYGLVGLGIYLTFRLIDFPDLTVDGSFTLGGVTTTICIINNYDPYLALTLASILGSVAGLITGCIYFYCKQAALLSGILTMTALFTFNFRLLGRSNISILTENNIFNGHPEWIVILSITIIAIILFALFSKTNMFLAMRALGYNKNICSIIGISEKTITFTNLVISNSLVALAGGLFSQYQGFADLSMGSGTLILGLAGIIIGELISFSNKITLSFIYIIIGTVIYRIIVSIALNSTSLGLQAIDIYLITTVLVLLLIFISNTIKNKFYVNY